MKYTKILLVLLFPALYVQADVVWYGKTQINDQIDASIVDVTDENLTIAGDVQLPYSGITISALTQDVDVYFQGGPNPEDTTVRSNDGAILSNLTYLNLVVALGREIRFHITESNVRFRGTNDEPALPLMMIAQGTDGGSGEVKFLFEQDHETLQFTSRPDSGGCKLYILRTADNGAPKVFFNVPDSSNKVIIGARSSIGMQVAGLTDAEYEGFVFDGTGAPGNYSNLVIKAFGSVGLETL